MDSGIAVALIGGTVSILGILAGAGWFRRRNAGQTAEAVAHIAEPTETAVGILLRQDAADAREMRTELRTLTGQITKLKVRAALLEERLKRAEEHAVSVESRLTKATVARDEAMVEHKRILAELAACRLELGEERAS